MLFPESELLRKQYISILVSANLLQEAKKNNQELISIDDVFLDEVIEAPSRDDINKLKKSAISAGIIAGELLAYMYILNITGVDEPSLGKALYIAGKVNKTRKRTGGRIFPSSEKQLRKYWTDYKSVAHIWGALLLLDEFQGIEIAESLEPILEQSYLSLAKILGDFGEEFIPLRTNPPKPILDVDIWHIPPEYLCDDYHFQIDQMPKYVKDLLSTYHH